MKVCVVGLGVVGRAQSYLLNMLGCTVYGHDPYIKETEPYIHLCTRVKKDVDFTFICIPEKAVDETVNLLVSEDVEGLFVIKSTVSIGTTKRLMDKHGVHLCHNPEFLREKTSLNDIMNPDRIIIGECCNHHGELLEKLYTHPILERAVFFRTDSSTSETVKLASNSYLSMLITFWNEINQLATKQGLDIHNVSRLVCADMRMSKYGTSKFGEAYAGKCLPKDLDHLIKAFHGCGLNPKLFEAVKKFNSELKQK